MIADLPYGFSKRMGVMLDPEAPSRLLCKSPISTLGIAEAVRALGPHLRIVPVSPDEFDARLEAGAGGARGDEAERIIESLDEQGDLEALSSFVPRSSDLLESIDEAPVIRLVNAVLTRAVRAGASDIHVEPYETRVAIRFRVDGVLAEILAPPRALASVLAARIKVMAKLDIAERRLPQDGRITLQIVGRAIDVRVATIPSGHGERVVLRLLDRQSGRFELGDLGLRDQRLEQVREMLQSAHGVILVTGPTGSGKTTSLYAALSLLNDKARNIMTVEDPIEYFIDGVGQTQVNSRVDMSFARGLRAILRQDPDVVMVGEVRDLETAQVAIQASLTGHLVMSTLHTNTAVGAVTRLRDMGVEPFLLSSSLTGVIAQRLARRLCSSCKVVDQSEDTRRVLSLEEGGEVFMGAGCEQCDGTGYRGRVGMFEVVTVDEELRKLIHDEASEEALEQHVRKQSSALLDGGLELILRGETSMEELRRISLVA